MMRITLRINKVLLLTTFTLLFFGALQFIYLYLHSFIIAPTYTGTVSDIIISVTNTMIAITAIRALNSLPKIFKEKTFDKTLNKIDLALLSLDECIDKFGTLYLNYKLINIYSENKSYTDPFFTKCFEDVRTLTTEALEASYRATSGISSLARWGINLDSEGGKVQEKMINDAFELGVKSTEMIMALANDIKTSSSEKAIGNINDFQKIYKEFLDEYARLHLLHKEFKKKSIHEIFQIKP